jgi:hypothetical protein
VAFLRLFGQSFGNPEMSTVEQTRPKRPKTGGRVAGTPNKATAEFRTTIAKLLDDNADNVGRWLLLVAEGDGTDNGRPDPARALDLLAKLAEYAAPKLNRTEHVGDPEKPVQTVHRIELVALGSRSG